LIGTANAVKRKYYDLSDFLRSFFIEILKVINIHQQKIPIMMKKVDKIEIYEKIAAYTKSKK
jgi:hypothetical protein